MNINYKKDLIKIALPLMLSNLITQIQMIIDRIFLGRIDTLYMSALGNATTPMWTTMSVLFTLTSGATILISQAIGAGQKDKVIDYSAATFKFNNIAAISLFFFWFFASPLVFKAMSVGDSVIKICIEYTRFYAPAFLISGLGASINVVLQTSGYTKPIMITGFIRSGLNVILDYCLIFGKFGFPNMGVAGAALATTISEYLGGFVLLGLVIRKKVLISKPSIKQILNAKFRPYLNTLGMGWPSATEDFAWNFGNLMLIRILNTINEAAAGIYTIVFGIEVLPVCIFASIGTATLTLSGQETGKRDLNQLRTIVRTSFVWSMIIAFANLVLFASIPKQLLGIFTRDSSILSSALPYMLTVGVALFPKAGNIIVGSGIRGFGDTRWMLYTQIFGTCFITAVSAFFVYVLHFGIYGVFAAVLLDEVTRCIINTIRLKRIKN